MAYTTTTPHKWVRTDKKVFDFTSSAASRLPSSRKPHLAAHNALMPKTFAVALILLAASVHQAHAEPAQQDMERLLEHKGLTTRLSDSIHQATDRATDLIRNAMGALGVPYRRGGTSAETGFDCSGFVRSMYQQAVGLILPRTAAEQAASTAQITKTDLQPGDLVFFNTLRRAYSHVGIYLGDGKFIHAPRAGAQVRVESMDISYWQKRFNGARRVLTRDSAATEAPAALPRVTERQWPAPSAVRLGGGSGKYALPAPAEIEQPQSGDRI